MNNFKKHFQTQDEIIREKTKTFPEKFPEYNFVPASTFSVKGVKFGAWLTLLRSLVIVLASFLLICSIIGLCVVQDDGHQTARIVLSALFAIVILACLSLIILIIKKLKNRPHLVDVADYIQLRKNRSNQIDVYKYLFFVKNQKFGLFRILTGNVIVPAEYDQLEEFNNGNNSNLKFLRMRLNDKYGLIGVCRSKCKVLVPAEYDKLEWDNYENRILNVEKDGETYKIDFMGNKLY